jgi:hypothetical protein
MWPITLMCAAVARAGALRVMSASGRPSQAERSAGKSVLMSRLVCLSTDAFQTLLGLGTQHEPSTYHQITQHAA